MSYSTHNGHLEHLVEQITDVIVARLNGDADAQQAGMCGCGATCFNRCPERMRRVVDAGAARIGLVLGETASAGDWSSLIDHRADRHACPAQVTDGRAHPRRVDAH